jgi:hypothetical protein
MRNESLKFVFDSNPRNELAIGNSAETVKPLPKVLNLSLSPQHLSTLAPAPSALVFATSSEYARPDTVPHKARKCACALALFSFPPQRPLGFVSFLVPKSLHMSIHASIHASYHSHSARPNSSLALNAMHSPPSLHVFILSSLLLRACALL